MKRRIAQVGALAALFAPSVASAGDGPAHAVAMLNAAQTVKGASYPHGVGAPLLDGVEQEGRFAIPVPDGFSEATDIPTYHTGKCWQCSTPDKKACANQCELGAAVNAPDVWSCADEKQPPALTALNTQYSPNQVATLAPLGTALGAAMACNYNHFASNPTIGTNADQAFSLTKDWASLIPTSIEKYGATSDFACNQVTFTTYLERVANSLHYVQDEESEHHRVGNASCSLNSEVLPALMAISGLADLNTPCYSWLNQSFALRQLETCDDEVVNRFAPGLLSVNASMLRAACYGGTPLACMGLERLLRHHCDLDGTKSIKCFGAADDHRRQTKDAAYCEGERFTAGGQDFVALASKASEAPFQQAMDAWAKVCKEPDDPCDPEQCETWCHRQYPQKQGYCTAKVAQADCGRHDCKCDDTCGIVGTPCCLTGKPCANATVCNEATGLCESGILPVPDCSSMTGAGGASNGDPTDDQNGSDGAGDPDGNAGGEGGAAGSGGPSDPGDGGSGSGGTREPGSTGGAGGSSAAGGGACAPGTCSTQPNAQSIKEPHLRTFDGLAYDFQATGEFVLFELTDDPQGPRAQVRQQPLASDLCPHVTLNSAVALSLNARRVAVYAAQPTPLWIDGVPTAMQPGAVLELGADSTLTMLEQNVWEARWGDSAWLRVKLDHWRGEPQLDLSLFAPASWHSRTRGLLGDFDGDSANEFRTRQGALLATPIAWPDLYAAFGVSYQISDKESLFEAASEAPFLTFTPPDTPTLAAMLSPALLDGVEPICKGTGVTDPALREACLLDVACSGGDGAQAEWLRASPPPSASAQIDYGDRFSAEHCQTLTPEGYSRVERILVPTDGSSVASQTPLEFGRTYKVRAWGTFKSGGPGDGLSDAEYNDFSASPKSIFDTCNNVDTGIAINAAGATAKATHWGTECASHAYTLDVVGQGAPLKLNFHDCALGDNHGTLTVDVLAPAPSCPGASALTPLAVDNGSFEIPAAGDVNAYFNLKAGSTALPGWTIDDGEIDMEEGSFWLDSDGTQSLDLNGIGPGTISQLLPTIAGQTYDVSFALAANTDCAPALKVIEVEAADQRASFQFDMTGHSKTNMGWQSVHFAFRAISSETRLSLRSLVAGSCGPALDDVRVAQLSCVKG
ncbi:MAG: choice-of-anchor C family protein [Polyangiaceae bacterium]